MVTCTSFFKGGTVWSRVMRTPVTWGPEREGASSYPSFIMEIIHVPEQKNKSWSLLEIQLQKYSFKAGRARGLSTRGVNSELEAALWDVAPEDSGQVGRNHSSRNHRGVFHRGNHTLKPAASSQRPAVGPATPQQPSTQRYFLLT